MKNLVLVLVIVVPHLFRTHALAHVLKIFIKSLILKLFLLPCWNVNFLNLGRQFVFNPAHSKKFNAQPSYAYQKSQLAKCTAADLLS